MNYKEQLEFKTTKKDKTMLNTHNLRIARKYKAFEHRSEAIKRLAVYSIIAIGIMGFWLVILLEVTK